MLNNFKLYCIVWNNKWSKWLLLLPIVFSVLVEAPVHATEEHISELSESKPHDLNVTIDRNIDEIIDETDRSNLTTDLETEEFTPPSLSVAELSTPETTTVLSETASPNPAVNNADHTNADNTFNHSSYTSANPDVAPDVAPDVMGQVTSVSQLSDVQPTDWAYQALQSLVERYGCIVGYPDSTFRGQRALTRYEFAAGLNACLDRIQEMIAASTENAITKEDLAALEQLQREFQDELIALRGRVDGLEARLAEVEANQFSTTTVLHGSAIFAAAGAFGDAANDNQVVARYRVNLSTVTSFTGRDILLLSMYAGNAPVGEINREDQELRTGSFDLVGTEVEGAFNGIPGTATASTAEGSLSSDFAANTNNNLQLLTAGYSFPVGDRLNIAVLTSLAPFQVYAPALNPYLNDLDGGTGAISVFGEYNPIYALAGGGTGAVLNYQIFGNLKLTAGYLADGLLVANPSPGNGLFNGGYAALGQLTWNITDNLAIAGVYVNEYSPSGRFGFNYNGFGVAGTAVANTLAGQDILGKGFVSDDASPVITNGYGVQFNWQPSDAFSLSGWFSTFYPRLIGEGDGNILTYALTFAFPDLGQDGNLLGLVVGAEPYLTEMGGNPQDFDVDVPIHVEAFYRHRIGDHIFVTPGIVWLTAPNQDRDNGSAFIATLRTTFTF